MSVKKRPVTFWIFTIFLSISILLMLIGQTISVFDYDLTVSMGLQEDPLEVGETVKQVNRGFGAGDTIIYVPLIAVSLIGLLKKKRWALITTAAVAGVSAYWTVTVGFIFLFLPGTPGYTHVPGPEIWAYIITYFVFGAWGLYYLLRHGEELIR